MGDHRTWAPLLICPRVSPRLTAFVAVSHTLALISIWLLPLGAERWLPMALIVVSALYAFYREVLRRGPWAIRAAIWGADGVWRLALGSGREIQARLSGSTFVSLPLVILCFERIGWRSPCLLVPADALDPDLLRQLRQRLRAQGRATMEGVAPDRMT